MASCLLAWPKPYAKTEAAGSLMTCITLKPAFSAAFHTSCLWVVVNVNGTLTTAFIESASMAVEW